MGTFIRDIRVFRQSKDIEYRITFVLGDEKAYDPAHSEKELVLRIKILRFCSYRLLQFWNSIISLDAMTWRLWLLAYFIFLSIQSIPFFYLYIFPILASFGVIFNSSFYIKVIKTLFFLLYVQKKLIHFRWIQLSYRVNMFYFFHCNLTAFLCIILYPKVWVRKNRTCSNIGH